MCRSSPSPLDMLETTFRLLTIAPHPLALEGTAVGLQAGRIGLRDLRAVLFRPGTSVRVQRAVLVQLVRRARRHRGAWLVGLVGVLLPGLPRLPARHTLACPGDVADLDARMLAVLLEQLDAPGASSEEVAERLLWTVVQSPADPASSTRTRVAWLSVRGLPGEPIPDGRRGSRDTSGLGELGLPAQETAWRRAARRPAVALP